MLTASHEDFMRDMLAEVLLSADRQWWLRRAEDFEAAKPRPTEFHGRATRAELRAAWIRCHETAQACRNRAQVAHYDSARQDVTDALGVVA